MKSSQRNTFQRYFVTPKKCFRKMRIFHTTADPFSIWKWFGLFSGTFRKSALILFRLQLWTHKSHRLSFNVTVKWKTSTRSRFMGCASFPPMMKKGGRWLFGPYRSRWRFTYQSQNFQEFRICHFCQPPVSLRWVEWPPTLPGRVLT